MKSALIVAFLCLSQVLFAQKDKYYNMSDVDQAPSPESVYILSKWGSHELKPGDLKKFKNVEQLRLSEVDFFPEGIREMKNLKKLSFFDCPNISTLPDWISELPLEEVQIEFCGFNTFPQQLFGLKDLKVLSLAGCNISSIPNEISDLQKLESLRLGDLGSKDDDCGYIGNPISSLPENLKTIQSLKYLYLYGCPISELPIWLGEMEALTSLGVAGTKIKIIPKELFKENKKGSKIGLGHDFKQEFDEHTMKALKEGKKEARGGVSYREKKCAGGGKYKLLFYAI